MKNKIPFICKCEIEARKNIVLLHLDHGENKIKRGQNESTEIW